MPYTTDPNAPKPNTGIIGKKVTLGPNPITLSADEVAYVKAQQALKNRNPLDVVGSVNDLINAYLITFKIGFDRYFPEIMIGIVLLVIMVIAAREFIKE